MNFEIKVDLREFKKAMRDLPQKQLPYAMAIALNDIGRQAVADVRKNMEQKLDRPTPFTLNAVYLQPAKKSTLAARILVREFAAKGTPAWKYLLPEIEGGARRMKRFERRLSDVSGGQYAVPGKGARLDQYGNVSRGQIMQILSGLDVMGEQNISVQRAAKLAKKKLVPRGHRTRSDYVVLRNKGNGSPIGIFRFTGHGRGRERFEQVFSFRKSAPAYTPRFDFNQVVATSVAKHQKAAFERALTHVLATMK